MSDSSQGDGWWQASDGKWYSPESRAGAAAPPPPQYAAAPPPAKKGRGCLIGGLAGVGGFVLLGVIALVVVIVIVVAASGGSDNKKKGTSPTVPVGQGTQDNPAVKDVTVTECKPGEAPVNFPEAKGEITNHSSKPSNYLFTVSFEVNGRRVAEGTAVQNNIQPGQTAAWTATGTPQTSATPIECKVPEVTRFAS